MQDVSPNLEALYIRDEARQGGQPPTMVVTRGLIDLSLVFPANYVNKHKGIIAEWRTLASIRQMFSQMLRTTP